MKGHKYILPIFLLLLASQIVNGQGYAPKQVIDSLKKELLKENLKDTSYINLLCALGEQTPIFRPTYWDTIAKEAEKALDKSPAPESKQVFLNALGRALNNIGYISDNQGDVQKALEYYHKSLRIQEEIDNKYGIAMGLNNIGSVYNNQGDITKALEYFQKSLKISESLVDKNGIAYSLNNIAGIYIDQGDTIQALVYYHETLDILEEVGDKLLIAHSLMNIGGLYSAQGRNHKALDHFLRSLNTLEEIGDKKGIAQNLNNIGVIYKNQGNVHLALEYYQRSLKASEELADKQLIAKCLKNIGVLEMERNELASAIKYGSRGLKLAQELGYPSLIKRNAGLLSKIARIQGNHKEALLMYELHVKMSDSIKNIETEKATIKQNLQYEFGKMAAADSMAYAKENVIKDSKLRRQKADIRSDRNKQLLLFGGVLLMVIFAWFMYKQVNVNNRQKILLEQQSKEADRLREQAEESIIKAQEQRNLAELNKEWSNTQTGKALRQVAKTNLLKDQLEEKNREIMDSIQYAANIQAAILTSTAYWNQMLDNYFIFYRPKDIVSGDFYWAYECPVGESENESVSSVRRKTTSSAKASGGKKIWIVADCTGHGVPGGFMSMLGNTMLNEIIIEHGIDEADEILNKLRDAIIKALSTESESDHGIEMKDGMDIALCILHPDNTLEYAGANNPLWIVSKKEHLKQIENVRVTADEAENIFLYEIKADKQPIGKYLNMKPFTSHRIKLESGDQIYTFSDGYPDQFGGPKNKKYMTKRLKKFLFSIANNSMNEQKELISAEMENWRQQNEQVDDICFIGVKI